jgi:hypothetical protein
MYSEKAEGSLWIGVRLSEEALARNCIMMHFIFCTVRLTLLGLLNQEW